MVVCKCRKATKLYCFVHKVPVCGECLCFPEHQICVVCTYSEWVIDGDYDWPPKCCHCQAELAEVTYPQTTRLGCLHVIHTICLVSHVKSFPPQTAPAGYVCPACSTPIWPPKVVKDSGSCLHSKLIEAVIQTGLEKNVFGSHPLPLLGQESRSSPPAFASEPLIRASATGDREYTAVNFSLLEQGAASTARPGNLDTLGIDGHGSETSSLPNHDANLMKSPSPTAPGTTIRKSIIPVDRQNSEVYYTDDEDAHGKSTHEEVCIRNLALLVTKHQGSQLGGMIWMQALVGPFRHKLLRPLLPFWSSALPTLPVTAPPRKDVSHGDDASERRAKHPRPSRMDPRKLLLIIAILSCMATMGILYYRIAQRGLGEELPDDEP